MRVMVLDDSRSVRNIIGKILREMKFDVVDAQDGVEALDRLKTHAPIDLVLVDWNLPKMNGLEFIEAVRKDHAYDHILLMMVTAETEREHVARALEAGANEYVMKPFSKDILQAKLGLLNICQD